MSLYQKATGVAAVLLAGLVGPASFAIAADMPEYPPIIEAPEPLPLPVVGGWYLRGDLGYKIYAEPSLKLSNPGFAAGQYSTNNRSQFIEEDMKDAFIVGVGAGYKFNEWIRTDVTLDYETGAKVTGKLYCTTVSTGCRPHPTLTDNYSQESAKIDAFSGLVNVYADLGEYGGLTPYVGAGAGVSYLRTSSVVSTSPAGAVYAGDGKYNVAWALMAGVSYAVDANWTVDVGYRYVDLGSAQSGSISDGIGGSTRINYEDITAHEVRVGLRYYID